MSLRLSILKFIFCIKNHLNIKEVMSTNVYVICIKSVDSVNIYSI